MPRGFTCSPHVVRATPSAHLGLIAAIVAAATVAGTAATPALADHDEPGRRVTLVGSLQSELGCPDDWSPPCPATAMQPRRRGRRGRSRSTCRPGHGSGRSRSTARGTAATRRATCRSTLEHAARLTFTYDDTSHRVARRSGRSAGGRHRGRSPTGRHLAARRPHARAVLLRDGRPFRERRSDQRHRVGSRATGWRRLRSDRQGLLPRWRHRRVWCRSSTTSRGSARPRSG